MSTVNQALLRLFSPSRVRREEAFDLSSQVQVVYSPAPVVSHNTAMFAAKFDAQSELASSSILAVSGLRMDSLEKLAGPHFRLPLDEAMAAVEAEPGPRARSAERPKPEKSSLAKPEAAAPVAEASWVVDRFELPEACAQLLAQGQAALEQLSRELAQAGEQSSRVVVVTSAGRGEGRSTLAICLAQAAGAAGLRVALVDGDLERPTLGSQLGLEAQCSWPATLREGRPIVEAAVRAIENRFTVWPLVARPQAAQLPSADQVAHMLRQLASKHDLVLVDAPPLALAESDAGGGHAREPRGAALLVRDVRRTTAAQLRQLVAQLHAAGLTPHGVVENFSNS